MIKKLTTAIALSAGLALTQGCDSNSFDAPDTINETMNNVRKAETFLTKYTEKQKKYLDYITDTGKPHTKARTDFYLNGAGKEALTEINSGRQPANLPDNISVGDLKALFECHSRHDWSPLQHYTNEEDAKYNTTMHLGQCLTTAQHDGQSEVQYSFVHE